MQAKIKRKKSDRSRSPKTDQKQVTQQPNGLPATCVKKNLYMCGTTNKLPYKHRYPYKKNGKTKYTAKQLTTSNTKKIQRIQCKKYSLISHNTPNKNAKQKCKTKQSKHSFNNYVCHFG